MPTNEVAAHTSAVTIATVPLHQKLVFTDITIDNQHTAELTIRIQDIFTPDVSNGVAVPAEKTIDRLQVTVPAGVTLSYQEDALKDRKCIGVAKAISDAVGASCIISCGYHFE
jgi:hypothetical protein